MASSNIPKERIRDRTGGKIVDVRVDCIMKDLHGVINDVPQIFDVAGACIRKDIHEQRTSSAQGNRLEQIDDGLVSRVAS